MMDTKEKTFEPFIEAKLPTKEELLEYLNHRTQSLPDQSESIALSLQQFYKHTLTN